MIVELEKACQDQSVLTALYREGLFLQERGFMRFPAAGWNEPAVAALVDGKCVAAVNYEIAEDEKRATILFAFCLPSHPQMLARCLLIWRGRLKDRGINEVRFTYHAGNEAMQKAGQLLRAELFASTFRASLSELPETSADDDLDQALAAMVDDYQTSEQHHPRHVLVPRDAFEKVKAHVQAIREVGAGNRDQLALFERAEAQLAPGYASDAAGCPVHVGRGDGADLQAIAEDLRGKVEAPEVSIGIRGQ
jgi:hypothetical protein